MKRPRLLVLAGLIVVLGVWCGGKQLLGDDEPATPTAGPRPRTAKALAQALIEAGRNRTGRIGWVAPPRLDGAVTIAGTVLDIRTQTGVGGVEVVFRSEAGEETTMAGPDGKYTIDVPIGTYRAFVRDEMVLSVGRQDHVRLPGLPSADSAGVPDEALMAMVSAAADADGVDLTVVRGGILLGKVVDGAGRAIGNVVVRAHSQMLRPTLGTDISESGPDGTFELRLPPGTYVLEVSHPRFAGIVGDQQQIAIEAGERQEATLTLAAGCVVAGRVVRPGGAPSRDGAIEKQWGTTDTEFSPAGRIATDGTFRWVTTEETEVVLRAWPWKAPPSASRSFACRDGARFTDIVFAIPDRGPDIEGILVDRAGAPVANAYIDLAPLDQGGISQQERTDEQGRWGVFQMPAGRYHIAAHAPGLGVVVQTINAPQTQVRLELGGTGRIEGTTTEPLNGSFELSFAMCYDAGRPVRLPLDHRVVTVVGGKFTVLGAPACDLRITASWKGRVTAATVDVPAGGAGHVELALGKRDKIVHGVVRDRSGRAVANAQVSSTGDGDGDAIVTSTDESGSYTMHSFAGAQLIAMGQREGGILATGQAQVSTGKTAEETIDIVLSDDVQMDTDEPQPQTL